MVNVANGDARSLLNALELAVETTPADAQGIIHISLAVAEESIQQRAVLYDKEGDVHFDTISAFIKSLRGSDPDAALYWLAKMVYAGEDPRFIFRRMLILASEDVGLADPNAIVIVNACNEAFDRVGMPEGRYHLAQATLYLATAPKSNSIMGFFDALASVEQEKEKDVPNHLKDANRDKKGFGHGQGYLYPHAYRDHWVAQQYLPASLQGQVFYQPSVQGKEKEISTQVLRRREAQLAALMEGSAVAPLEILTYGSSDRASERWLQRTLSQVGTQLATVRERIFDLAQLQRHHLVLDINAGTGLLTWEAIRQVPFGGVYACVRTSVDANALQEQAAALPELMRPVILTVPISRLSEVLAEEASNVQFDCIMGRNALMSEPDKLQTAQTLAQLIPPGGKLVLAETVPRYTQRLYRLLQPHSLDASLYKRLVDAEEAMYVSQSDPMLNWDADDLRDAFASTGLVVDMVVEQNSTQMHISSAFLERLFATKGNRPSYAQRLGEKLTLEELERLKATFTQCLLNQTIDWQSAIAFLKAYKV